MLLKCVVSLQAEGKRCREIGKQNIACIGAIFHRGHGVQEKTLIWWRATRDFWDSVIIGVPSVEVYKDV